MIIMIMMVLIMNIYKKKKRKRDNIIKQDWDGWASPEISNKHVDTIFISFAVSGCYLFGVILMQYPK